MCVYTSLSSMRRCSFYVSLCTFSGLMGCLYIGTCIGLCPCIKSLTDVCRDIYELTRVCLCTDMCICTHVYLYVHWCPY